MNKVKIGAAFVATLVVSLPVQAITIGSDNVTNTDPFTSEMSSLAAARKQSDWDSNINSDTKLETIDKRVAELTGEAPSIKGGVKSSGSIYELLSDLESEINVTYAKASSAYSLGSSASTSALSAYSLANSANSTANSAKSTASSAYSIASSANANISGSNSCLARSGSSKYLGSKRYFYEYYWNGGSCQIKSSVIFDANN